jgi:hypothetical protein
MFKLYLKKALRLLSKVLPAIAIVIFIINAFLHFNLMSACMLMFFAGSLFDWVLGREIFQKTEENSKE